MGLDASVMCNCFRDRKTTPPPFPRDWLEIDREGYLNLKQEHDSDENWANHYEWEQSCCEHEGMALANERISNWAGYRQFQAALGEVGWQHFPVLEDELPSSNGGLTSSAASARALLELDLFMSCGEVGSVAVLVNTASSEGLYEHIAAYGGIFIRSGRDGIDVGLSEFEFFAVNRESGEDLFRARRVRQYNRGGTKISESDKVIVWEDLETGITYESGIPIAGKQIPWDDGRWENEDGRCRFDYPYEFHVEQRPRVVADFDRIVRALRIVFEASVQSGNPVRWC